VTKPPDWEALSKEERPPAAATRVVTERPSIETMEAWSNDGGCEATDGCWVEVDGTCPHEHKSWMLQLGLV